MKIVLIGFMCSGKSSVGRLLAKKMNLAYFDTDEMVEKQVGAAPADIIRQQGEEAFREIERKAVQLVSLADACVISTGGGVPLSEENMKDLSTGGILVWLKVSPDTVLKRAGNFKSRPLIDPADPLGSITQKMKDREPFYRKAQFTVEADSLSQSEIVEAIQGFLPSIPQ